MFLKYLLLPKSRSRLAVQHHLVWSATLFLNLQLESIKKSHSVTPNDMNIFNIIKSTRFQNLAFSLGPPQFHIPSVQHKRVTPFQLPKFDCFSVI